MASLAHRGNCPLCTLFAAKNLKGVVRHVGSIHAHDSNFGICCGLDGCHRTYKRFVSYKKHIYEKHLKKSHTSGVGVLQDMEVSNDGQDGFDDNISSTTVGSNQTKISALFLLKLENEYKVASTALDCIIEDVTTLFDFLRNEVFSKLSQKNITIDSEITSVFETAVVRNPFEGLCSEYFRDKYYREELQYLVSLIY